MNPGRISGDVSCSAAAAFLSERPGEADCTQSITLSASLVSHKSDERACFSFLFTPRSELREKRLSV
ncbi:hypothetical protein CesoFtcFv8_025019 [Champsocephalus esox]|uniref:Uncharacterized protein n=1 Tax=Champsocephalus esox TaxID=159716 RepID=A0AAN8GEC6_9TELE|nr:hypothetical protein CesoFtcFv8_025019 [Champsocephalus esox]